MTLLDDFLVRALLAGVGVVVAAAPLGCFVVWRKMAYYGDATAHAAILGVAFSLAFNISVFAGVFAVALAMALVVSALDNRKTSMDTMLGVLSHSALAIGLVAVSLVDGVRVDLMSYLFGDILAVGRGDIALIWAGALIVLFFLWWRWSGLLTATLNPDLAIAAGISPRREQLLLAGALAIVVALAISVVGVLLISALLLIPPATARPFAQTPERMAILATGIGTISVFLGIVAAFTFDTPTGPTIVSCAALLFAVSSLAARLMGRS
ncbi:metal ABC transporter permease [Celeribacter arenosi]|uniref:High-affinity zinc uptake system membrane protein ZnuB n=1 Tax=Celeribacter arenosi TaxID=792649 RepID=A0ABP7K051_9RHOB